MKPKFSLFSAVIFLFVLSPILQAQEMSPKEQMKYYESQYACFSKHKPIYDNNNWGMIKLHIVYKITTAKVSKSMTKNDYIKVKSSSGAYGILTGVTEADLQNITDQIAQNFIKRMKEEAGISVTTWSSFETSENTEKIKEQAQEGSEIYSKSQGLGYCVSYDGTPVWNRVLAVVPGGKKLAKETGAHNAQLTIYVDFADVTANSSTYIKNKGKQGNYIVYEYGESADQSITTGVRIIPNMGSQNTWEAATNLGSTSIILQSQNLHSWTMVYAGTDPYRMLSDIPYAESVNSFEGDLPEVLLNRSNKKIEYVNTFEVKTTPEKYGSAVEDATNIFFTDIITYYNLTKNK